MKNLVVCGTCEIEAGTSVKKWIGSGFNIELKRPGGVVLGEVTDDGGFLIKRGGQNYTKIVGENFDVLCGRCGNVVYRKEVDGTSSDQRVVRIHRESVVGTFQFIGTN
jgi:hypothetical protein